MLLARRHWINRRFAKMATRRSSRLVYAPTVVANNQDTTIMEPQASAIGDAALERPAHTTPKRPRFIEMDTVASPTPFEAKIMAVPYSSGDVDEMTPPPKKSRIVDPRFTNAPLVSPMTHRVVANPLSDEVSPSKKTGVTSTTESVLEKALQHLRMVDPRLIPVIEKHYCHVFSPDGLAEEIDPFRSLASGIISQQVSGAAAKSIKAKFVALFNLHTTDGIVQTFPSPTQVAAKDISTLRSAGLSQRKAEYIQGLAQKFATGDLSTEMLLKADYDEVLEKLIAVRGLGKWSVEMFACFGLKRMDVFSTGDLGVQRGMAALIGKDVSKLKAKGGGKWKYMSEKDMLDMAEPFAPYR